MSARNRARPWWSCRVLGHAGEPCTLCGFWSCDARGCVYDKGSETCVFCAKHPWERRNGEYPSEEGEVRFHGETVFRLDPWYDDLISQYLKASYDDFYRTWVGRRSPRR